MTPVFARHQALAAGAERELAMDPHGAEVLYRKAADAHPDEVLPRLYLSKTLSDKVFFRSLSKEEARALGEAACAISAQVVADHPAEPKARMMHAANMGRLAMVSGNRQKARLVGRVRAETEEALRLLAGDTALAELAEVEARIGMASASDTASSLASTSTGQGDGSTATAARLWRRVAGKARQAVRHTKLSLSRGRRATDGPAFASEGEWLSSFGDIVHHSLGVWHREMAQLHPVVRYAVRVLYGAKLDKGSFETALYHFRRAHEIKPRLVHSVECAKAHVAMGNRELAIEEVTRGLALPLEDVSSWHIYQDGLRLKAALEEGRMPTYGGHPDPEPRPPSSA